jgi:mono/diheme cytochrome c family protein
VRSYGTVLLLLVVMAAPIGCTHGTQEQGGHSAEAEAPTDTAGVASDTSAGGEAPAAVSAPWKLPTPDLGYNAREGRALFRYYCATCHGDEGHGDGFNAYNLDPKPRDLADPAFQAKRSDSDLLAVIRSGGAVAGLSTGMPPWGHTLNERQLHDLVDYVRTLVPEAGSTSGAPSPQE